MYSPLWFITAKDSAYKPAEETQGKSCPLPGRAGQHRLQLPLMGDRVRGVLPHVFVSSLSWGFVIKRLTSASSPSEVGLTLGPKAPPAANHIVSLRPPVNTPVRQGLEARAGWARFSPLPQPLLPVFRLGSSSEALLGAFSFACWSLRVGGSALWDVGQAVRNPGSSCSCCSSSSQVPGLSFPSLPVPVGCVTCLVVSL